MKRMIFNLKRSMTIALLLLPLIGNAQNTDVKLNAVKVFDLDTDSIYNFYIDTIGTESGNAVFCFQTITGKLVKTDSNGSIISTTPNSYKYFAVYQGDTLFLDDTIVINSKGDHIASILYEGENRSEFKESDFIAVSPSGIYTYWGFNPHSTKASYGDQIRNVIGSDRLTSSIFATHIIGLCVYQETIYALHYNFSDEYVSIGCKHEPISPSYDTIIDQVNLRNPAGIAGYNGYLYVYSNTDKALYRLETPEGYGTEAFKKITVPDDNNHNETIFPLYQDYVVIPDRFFVKKSTGVTQDYLISLLEDEFNGNYQIEGWIGDDICKVIVDDSLIDTAVAKLINNNSILVARRIYAERVSYEQYLNGAPIKLDEIEMCIFNEIAYGIRNGYSQNQMDIIADVYGLVNTPNPYNSKKEGMFGLSKTTDIFEMSRTLYEIGCFTYIQPNMYMQVVLLNPTLVEEKETQPVQVLETKYYNITGQTTDSPSGLILVVTRYSDGTVSTEKKLFY